MSVFPSKKTAHRVLTGLTAVGLVQNSFEYVAFAQAPAPVTIIYGSGALSTTNPLPVSASVSASIAGFNPLTAGVPIAVGTALSTGTLPSGAVVVVVTNVGATNPVYCALGTTAGTTVQYIAPSGGWFAFTVGTATQLSCVTSSGTTIVNMVGGSGIPTGTGGGGGGSGGSVTQGTSPWVDNITQWAGTTLGTATTWGSPPSGNVIGANVNIVAGLNSNGQQNMSGSAPVVVASDQSVIPVSLRAGTASVGTATAGVNVGNSIVPLHVCGTYTTLAMTALTTLQIIPGASGQTIYICDFDVSNNATTAALNFVIGTGTNCATNSSVLGQVWYMNANWGKSAANAFYRGVNSGAVSSASLCVQSNATATFQVGVYYDKY